ncbi:hypothetical protein K440DRAFT_35507 [Wilcoxina mikolae CBS 423.85]|nr:hypothetical protein K440DRAFT_35507 [Wilcoxina mikolae CBS 423.85]
MGLGDSSVGQLIVSDWKIHAPDGETVHLEVKETKIAITTTRECYTPLPPLSFITAAPPTLIHPGVLLFDTSSAFFRVCIGNEHGVNCVCYKDGEKPLDGQFSAPPYIRETSINSLGVLHTSVTVITSRSRSIVPTEMSWELTISWIFSTCAGYDTTVLPILEMCVFNATLIEWWDGIAYRLGLGRIHEVAWSEENPTWKTMFLE